MLSVEPPVDNSLVKQDCFSLIRRLSKSITFADSHGCRSMTCFVVVLLAKKNKRATKPEAYKSLLRRSIFLLGGWSPSCCGIWNNFCRGHFQSAPRWATSHKDCMFCRLVIPNGGSGTIPAKIILLRCPTSPCLPHPLFPSVLQSALFDLQRQPPSCRRLWKHLNNKMVV